MSFALHGQVKRPRNIPGYDNKKIHFGFTIGLNTMDMIIKRSSVNELHPDIYRIEPGFQVNIVSDLRLNDYMNLRFLPGIDFGQRYVSFYNTLDGTRDAEKKIESSYLDFPLLLKYRSKRLNNYRPYLIGGASFRYDMAARKDFDEESVIRFKPADLYIELGTGIDFYFQYFKFSTEIKLAIGMLNVLVDDPAQGKEKYLNAFEGLQSYLVMINFHFE